MKLRTTLFWVITRRLLGYEITTTHRVMIQKSAVLSYFAADAWYHATPCSACHEFYPLYKSPRVVRLVKHRTYCICWSKGRK